MAERVFALPDLGEGLEEAEVGGWLVAEGDVVALNQSIAEVETAKAVVEIPSPFAGRVVRLHANPGDTVGVGEPLITFEVEAADAEREPAPTVSPPIEASIDATTPTVPAGPVAATPAVRRLAKDLGVDLGSVPGTGPGGRIIREDVDRAARTSEAPAAGAGDVEVLPISVVRRTIAEKLTRVVREVPSVTTFRTLDCTALEATRTDLGISPLPIVVRALADVCRDHPMLNASYLGDRGEIHVHRSVHVGIATDTERGLLVPVVRDVDRLGIAEVAAEISRLATAARAATLRPADMSGATITVTNTGSYGSEAGTPILDPPQGAILALGAIAARALVVDGRVVPRPACTLSLTFDHRLLDGATAGRAFADLVDLLGSAERVRALPR